MTRVAWVDSGEGRRTPSHCCVLGVWDRYPSPGQTSDLHLDQLVQPGPTSLDTGLHQPERVGRAVQSSKQPPARSKGRIIKCPAKGWTLKNLRLGVSDYCAD